MNLDEKYTYAKAVAASIAAALASLITALTDNAVTPAEWASIVLAGLVGSGLVVAVAPRNKYSK